MSQEFLHRKYRDLNTSPEVQSAATRHEQRTGERLIPQRPEARIQAYLDRLKVILEPEALRGADGREIASAEDRKARNIAMLKQTLHDHFVIKPAEIPDSYFQSIIRRHREEGRPLDDIPAEQRAELIEPLIADQQRSLDLWVEYLTSPNAKYPDDLKYWAFRSMLGMSTYDKEKQAFDKRGKGSVSPFPELNQEALALALGAVEKLHGQGTYDQPDAIADVGYGIDDVHMRQFQEAVRKENFPKLYAWLIEQFKPIANELLKTTEGTWVHYPQGSNPADLVAALRDYGTGWCIRGEATARRYLQGDIHSPGNDLHVYYSNNEQGQPTVPRAVIVMRDGVISEVRGIAKQENVDPDINDTVEEKLKEFGTEGEKYKKRFSDNRQLTTLEGRVNSGQPLNRDELMFLYEVDTPIEWFGYGQSPRIAELRKQRDVKADMLTIFECDKDQFGERQIAHSPAEVTEHTKAYVGPLYPEIFTQLQHLEHIYTAFPEKKMRRTKVEIGGKTKEQLQDELDAHNIQTWDWTKQLMTKMAISVERTTMEIVKLTVADLGFPSGCTTTQLFQRATELGLELCPAELGLHYRLQYMDQPKNEWLSIGMESITGSDDIPRVFLLHRRGDKLKLNTGDASPDSHWYGDRKIAFSLRSPKGEASKVEAVAA